MSGRASQQQVDRPPDGVATDRAQIFADEAHERVADLLGELLQHVDGTGRKLIAALASAEDTCRARELSLYRARLLDSLPHHQAAIDAALPRARPALAAVFGMRGNDKPGPGARGNAHG